MQNEKLKTQIDVTKSLEMHKMVQRAIVASLCKDILGKLIDEWADDLWIFREAYGKMLYSEISTFIIETQNDDTIQLIERNIGRISSHMDSSYTKKGIAFEQYAFWLKFQDHCKLAVLQRRHYNISRATIKDVTDGIIKSEFDKIQKELTSQLIGLVSIFTALSFVVFGGITVFNSILENIRFATITRMLCAGLLWTVCMSLLFYIFVRFILKIMKPEQEQVLSKQFMVSFWIMMGVLVVALVVFVVLSFFAPQLFAII